MSRQVDSGLWSRYVLRLTWLLEKISLDGLTRPSEPRSLDGLTWLPEQTSLDGLTRLS